MILGMDFFQISSLISILLSIYLTICKIFDSFVRINIDVYDLYKSENFIYIKVSFYNKSSNSVAITRVSLGNENNNLTFDAVNYPKQILKIKKKRNGEIYETLVLSSDKVPLNIPPKNATPYLLAFPTDANRIDDLINDGVAVKIKVNRRTLTQSLDIKFSNIENLKKELKEY